MPHVAALLAAGEGSRFAGPEHKLQARLRGRPVWRWALEHVTAAAFDHVLVVTGAWRLDPADIDDGRVTECHNPEWAQGQAGSVRLATAAAAALGASALTIGLADQPFVTSTAWDAVAHAETDRPIVIATYDGVPGPNPVRLDRAVWPLLATTGDAGARDLIREHPEWVYAVACVGSVADIDTLEDLDRWNRC